MTEVYLAVYDLSQGMARSLSAQFLGPDHIIDMIPHTALLVFGKEYFFGGGIQSVDPHYFRSMTGRRPVQTERLGTTRVSQADFDAWCQQIASLKYNVRTYDLLNCNCNHFSHDAALQGLKLSRGVPSWVLQVPQRFLASPMGQMIRPMLEQMQITQTSPVQVPSSLFASPSSSTIETSTGKGTPSAATSATAAAAAAVTQNPWSSSMTGTTSSSARTNNPMSAPKSRPITPPLSTTESILNKYTKPMLSTDTQSVNLCASKLCPLLNATTQHALQDLCSKLLEKSSPSIHAKVASQESIDLVVPELWKLIQNGKVVSFALLFLRLLVLRFANSKEIKRCMLDLMQSLSDESSNSNLFPTPASRSLAWCVASNFASCVQSLPIPPSLVDAAVRDWNHDAIQVRQAACTFLYNFVICNGPKLDHDEETVVSLVCSSLESLIEETDPTTRLRKLLVGVRVVFGVHHSNTTTMIASNIINNENGNNYKNTTIDEAHSIEQSGCNEMAKDLIQDLGFVSLLQELAVTYYDTSNATHPDTTECQHLALELIDKLQS